MWSAGTQSRHHQRSNRNSTTCQKLQHGGCVYIKQLVTSLLKRSPQPGIDKCNDISTLPTNQRVALQPTTRHTEIYTAQSWTPNHKHTLKLGMELVPERSENLHILMQLSAWENFTEFCHSKSCKTYIIHNSLPKLNDIYFQLHYRKKALHVQGISLILQKLHGENLLIQMPKPMEILICCELSRQLPNWKLLCYGQYITQQMYFIKQHTTYINCYMFQHRSAILWELLQHRWTSHPATYIFC